jgi:hypothetical protein
MVGFQGIRRSIPSLSSTEVGFSFCTSQELLIFELPDSVAPHMHLFLGMSQVSLAYTWCDFGVLPRPSRIVPRRRLLSFSLPGGRHQSDLLCPLGLPSQLLAIASTPRASLSSSTPLLRHLGYLDGAYSHPVLLGSSTPASCPLALSLKRRCVPFGHALCSLMLRPLHVHVRKMRAAHPSAAYDHSPF